MSSLLTVTCSRSAAALAMRSSSIVVALPSTTSPSFVPAAHQVEQRRWKISSPNKPNIKKNSGVKGPKHRGWYIKYKEGRAYQGRWADRDHDELSFINEKVLSFGSRRLWMEWQVGGGGGHGTTAQEDIISSDNRHRFEMEIATVGLPNISSNFELLLKDGYYNNTKIYRVEKDVGFCLGDIENLDGDGGYCHPDATGAMITRCLNVRNECLAMSHLPGTLCMLQPNVWECDSRFLVITEDSPHLDGRHLVFGRLKDEETLERMRDLKASLFLKRGIPSTDVFVVGGGVLGPDDNDDDDRTKQQQQEAA